MGGKGRREGKEGKEGWDGRGTPPLLILQFNHCISLTVYEIFSVKLHDLENWVTDCSRSLKMAQFDRSCTTFYWSAIANIALSATVFELFDIE